LSFASYGLTIGVRTNEPRILPHVAKLLPPGWRSSTASRVDRLYSLVVGGPARGLGLRRFTLLYADAMRLARSLEVPEVLRALESDVQLYVAAGARRRLFVHAGVVGWRGRAIVIPGRSMSGKSTLVAALIRAGATYYSDEYAVFDDQGRVHPYPKALSLRDGSVAARADVPRPGRATAPLPLGLLAVTRYRRGARWRPRPLSPGRAWIELLAHTVAARRHPARALSVFTRALAGTTALKGARGEAAEVVDAVFGAAAG
jgi:hypothetical protein